MARPTRGDSRVGLRRRRDMPRRARLLLAAVASAGAFAVASGTAAAVPLHATGWNPEDGPLPAAQEHPGGPGHLPPGSRNMELVGKVRLTGVAGGIADVAAFGNY